MIFEILAMTEDGLIGSNNAMPWHLPNDFKYFKKTTMGFPVVMGRKTWESIGARPLPGRENIVLTHAKGDERAAIKAKGCTTFDSIYEIEEYMTEKDFFVIGGASLYEAFLPKASRLYVTIVHGKFDGDTFFCNPSLEGWKLISSEEGIVDEKNAYAHTFKVYERAD